MSSSKRNGSGPATSTMPLTNVPTEILPTARATFWGPFLYRDAMARFEDQLASLQE
jgi:hypothetical protein